MRKQATLILTGFLLNCGSADADISLAMQSTQALQASADEASDSSSSDNQLVLHVVRTEAHVANTRGRGAAEAGANAGWHTISDERFDLDILSIVEQAEEVANGAIPHGKLTQIRLILASEQQATLHTLAGEQAVQVPSGSHTGLKLVIAPPVDVEPDGSVHLQLEMDGQVEAGVGTSLTLTPVLRLKTAD